MRADRGTKAQLHLLEHAGVLIDRMNFSLGRLIWVPSASENRSRVIIVYGVRLCAEGEPRRRADICPI